MLQPFLLSCERQSNVRKKGLVTFCRDQSLVVVVIIVENLPPQWFVEAVELVLDANDSFKIFPSMDIG